MSILETFRRVAGLPVYNQSTPEPARAGTRPHPRPRMLPPDPQASLSAAAENPRVAGDWKLSGSRYAAHSLLQDLHGYGASHEIQMEFWHLLWRGLPILATAIRKRRGLEGRLAGIETRDEGLAREVRGFIESIPVGWFEDGGTAQGLNIYLDGLLTSADVSGLGVGEEVYAASGRILERLVLPDMRTFQTRRNDAGRFELIQYQRSGDGAGAQAGDRVGSRMGTIPRVVRGAAVHKVTFAIDSFGHWPKPLVFGLESVSEVLVRMMHGVNNLWMRVADPSNLTQIVYDKEAMMDDMVEVTGADGNTYSVTRAVFNLKTQLDAFNQSKASGRASDIMMSVSGGEVKRISLFDDPATSSLAPYVDRHMPEIKREIIDRSDVPAFLYAGGEGAGDGLGSSRSQAIAAMAMAAAEQRRAIKERIACRIIDSFLLTIGRPGAEYSCEWEAQPITDQKVEAETRETDARRDSQVIENAMMLFPVDPGAALGGSGDGAEPGEEGAFAEPAANLSPEAIEYLRRRGVLREDEG